MDASNFKPIDIQTLTMQVLQPLHSALDPDFSDKQRELAEAIYIGLINSDAAQACTPAALAQAAMAVLVQLGHDLGGQTYYLAKLGNLRVAKMNRAIRTNFNGRNHAQLGQEHRITEVRVRQILNPTKPKNGSK